mmetsp:Transcript_63317/g.167794  ORF Transcript_63317/g.167794 Transcript_63317/m.167794 type:complete len:269 (-) Transcript_63317:1206-2012(-)
MQLKSKIVLPVLSHCEARLGHILRIQSQRRLVKRPPSQLLRVTLPYDHLQAHEVENDAMFEIPRTYEQTSILRQSESLRPTIAMAQVQPDLLPDLLIAESVKAHLGVGIHQSTNAPRCDTEARGGRELWHVLHKPREVLTLQFMSKLSVLRDPAWFHCRGSGNEQFVEGTELVHPRLCYAHFFLPARTAWHCVLLDEGPAVGNSEPTNMGAWHELDPPATRPKSDAKFDPLRRTVKRHLGVVASDPKERVPVHSKDGAHAGGSLHLPR